MYIKSVKLKNFRQFIDDEIEFHTSKEKPLVLIEGCNASGKTTIMEAIRWCLTGDIHIHGTILNKKIFKSLPINEEVDVIVEVIFICDDKRFLVKKVQKMKKVETLLGKEVVQSISSPELSVFYQDEYYQNQMVKPNECQTFINELIPYTIQKGLYISADYFHEICNKVGFRNLPAIINEILPQGLTENKKYPLIFDSPLNFLAKLEAERMCSIFPNILGQVIILTKDYEANLIKKNIGEYISDYVKLNLKENADGTFAVSESKKEII